MMRLQERSAADRAACRSGDGEARAGAWLSSRSPAVTVVDVGARRGTSYPRMVRNDRELVLAWTGDDSRVQTAVVR